MTVLAIANRKGGVGKTTLAVNLGHGLAMAIEEQGKHVLIIDLDPQGNVCTVLGITAGENNVADVLTGECELDEALVSANRPADGLVRNNLWVLPSSDKLADARAQLLSQFVMDNVMNQIGGRKGKKKSISLDSVLSDRLGGARDAFAYIVLDCPPSLDMLGNAVYEFADEVIVPVKTDFLGVTGTAQHTENIIDAQEHGIDIKVSWIVPTFVRGRERLARQMIKALKKGYREAQVLDGIPQAVAIEQAPAAGGKTIFEYAPDHIAAKAYWEIVEKVIA